MAIHLTAAFRLSQSADPGAARRATKPSVIFIGSVAGLVAWEGDVAYNVAKAGLHHLARCIAADYAKQGLRANVIAPGVIDTPLTRGYASGMEGGEARGMKVLAGLHPIGRYATPEEIAGAAVVPRFRQGRVHHRRRAAGRRRPDDDLRERGDGQANDEGRRLRRARRRRRPRDCATSMIDDPHEMEVRVKLLTTGICRSDIHYLRGVWVHPKPVILGHEACGIIESVGPGVPKSRIGEKVVLTFTPSCGHCRFCVVGRSVLCEEVARAAARGHHVGRHHALLRRWTERRSII